MENDEVPHNLKEESNNGSSSSAVIPASFKGRLNLSDFTFSPKLESNDDSHSHERRQSLRKSSSTLLTPPTSGPKRKLDGLIPSSSPKKKSRSPSGYAPPSTYAHLPELVDVLEPNLLCVFVGLNPGIETARSGHAYAHPSNLFWKLLYSSGCTTRRCRPEEDRDLPRIFSLGNTNIVARPTRNGSELSKGEMDASVHVLEDKMRKYKPEVVCIVGKSIWESIWRVRHGKAIKKEEFKYGWQGEDENMGVANDQDWRGSKVFVATSTSGLAATLLPAEKERVWRELGVWVEQKRAERSERPERCEV
ncbi:uracil mismatch repair [Hyphodiscus hymeniophilus]|uniref:Uracil mismatch repair n=1 Tax=Hyphodiscus hymeniophilus TaxID=353542 RepID=A0A9P6VRN4_9HELO|nr:uracil mismatch repair [Hyphodiscus hymeniophilus]